MVSQGHTKKRSAQNASVKLEVIGYAKINRINFIPILTQKITVHVILKQIQ